MRRLCTFFFLHAFVYLLTTLMWPANPSCVEARLIQQIRVIQRAEVLYSVTGGHGTFADLETLGKLGLIDSALVLGNTNDYRFDLSALEGRPPMFDIAVQPIDGSSVASSARSFYANETMLIYATEARGPFGTSRQNRVPTTALPIDRVPNGP
jgi:hypothetical protein